MRCDVVYRSPLLYEPKKLKDLNLSVQRTQAVYRFERKRTYCLHRPARCTVTADIDAGMRE